MRKSLLTTLSLVAVVLVQGCGGRHDASEKYFLVATNVKLPYWQTAASGLGRAARQLGVYAEMVGPDTYDPAAEQQHEA